MPEQIILIALMIAIIFSATIQKAGGHLKLLLQNYPGQIFSSEVAIFGVAFIGFLVFFI